MSDTTHQTEVQATVINTTPEEPMTATETNKIKLPNEIALWFEDLDPLLKNKDKFPEWALLSLDQWIAVYEICNGRYKRITLTGIAGSGKTFVVSFCKKLLETANHEVMLLASTGIAAFLIGGTTINKALSMGADNNYLPNGLADRMHPGKKPMRVAKGNQQVAGVQQRGRQSLETICRKIATNGLFSKDHRAKPLVVFFEEVGMSSAENLTIAVGLIEQYLGYNKVAQEQKRPVRFIFLGDYRQLTPVPSKHAGTPWTIYTNLAINTAKFDVLTYKEEGYGNINYSCKVEHFDSPLGINIPTNPALPIGNGNQSLIISLVNNHRQGDAGDFTKDLNSIGDGSADFTIGSDKVPMSVLSKVYCYDAEDKEWFNYVASKKKQNVILDESTLEDAIHIYYTNAAVSKRNTIGTDKAILHIKRNPKIYPKPLTHYYRDYPVIITSTNNRANPNARVDNSKIEQNALRDIAPIGVTTIGVDDRYYQQRIDAHRNVCQVTTAKETIMGYQRICVGMRWMCRLNISDMLKNGTTCTVTYVADDYFNVVVDNDPLKKHLRVEVNTQLFVSTNEYGLPIADIQGVPGHPAYALTFHKTQGMTVKESKVVLHIDETLVRNAIRNGMHGVFYVGLSRVQVAEQLIILYESSALVEVGLTALSKSNATVYKFIQYSEANMHKLLADRYDHTYHQAAVTPKPTAKPVIKAAAVTAPLDLPELDLFT